MCHHSRPSLLQTPLGLRCQRCLEEGILPSERTQIRFSLALLLSTLAFIIFPPLLLLWLPWQALSGFFWAPVSRGRLLGGLGLLLAIWIVLVPEVISIETDPIAFQASTLGIVFLILSGLLLLFWFWPAVRLCFFELLFRGRGFAAGVLRSGAIVSIFATFLLALMPIVLPG